MARPINSLIRKAAGQVEVTANEHFATSLMKIQVRQAQNVANPEPRNPRGEERITAGLIWVVTIAHSRIAAAYGRAKTGGGTGHGLRYVPGHDESEENQRPKLRAEI